MGFLAPAAAAIGSALAGVGTAATAGALTGAAATAAGAAVVGSSVIGTAAALKGAPDIKLAAPAAAPAIAAPSPAAAPISPISGGKNKSLAALSPGLALGGTSSVLGSSAGASSGRKTLLGQ